MAAGFCRRPYCAFIDLDGQEANLPAASASCASDWTCSFFRSVWRWAATCRSVPPISRAIFRSVFPRANRRKGCFSRGLRIKALWGTSSCCELVSSFLCKCRSTPISSSQRQSRDTPAVLIAKSCEPQFQIRHLKLDQIASAVIGELHNRQPYGSRVAIKVPLVDKRAGPPPLKGRAVQPIQPVQPTILRSFSP